jgi:hypothetical protein
MRRGAAARQQAEGGEQDGRESMAGRHGVAMRSAAERVDGARRRRVSCVLAGAGQLLGDIVGSAQADHLRRPAPGAIA